jgi:sterol desaturase/sphingolipid hydroxylase (fatty acid hydroxylase superfamily)
MMEQERTIRLLCFVGIFLLCAIAEALRPKRPRDYPRHRRWRVNFGMLVLGSVAVPLFFSVLAVELARRGEAVGWGLLHQIGLPYPLRFVAGLVLLDFIIYLQHVLSHQVPLFWRVHRVHHTDGDLDASSALRFHPIEILASMLLKLLVVAGLGAPPAAVLLFEIILNGMALFNHANLNLPLGIDRALRAMLVTPDMHRVHHSTIVRETNSNFGFNLSCWDRLFGTYRPQPQKGHAEMQIGLREFSDAGDHGLGWTLTQPLLSQDRKR